MRRKNKVITFLIIVFAGLILTSYSLSIKESEQNEPIKKDNSKEFIQRIIPPKIPTKLSFAGEMVPLENFDIKESLDREILVNSYFHSQTIRFLKLAPRYFKIIEPILKRDSIPDDFKYLALAESGFDPKAISPAGAAGIWQFMKPTAKENGLEVNNEVDERYHIEKSTEAACKYLHESFEKYQNWTTVAASYNAGRRGVDRQIERQKEPHYYNLLLSEETNRYVFRILALKTIIESPEKYGFFIKSKDKYPSIPVNFIEVNGKVEDFADFAKSNNINYKILKMYNPWLRETFLTNKTGKTYQIKVPKNRIN